MITQFYINSILYCKNDNSHFFKWYVFTVVLFMLRSKYISGSQSQTIVRWISDVVVHVTENHTDFCSIHLVLRNWSHMGITYVSIFAHEEKNAPSLYH